ncbi:MAG: hypothetical protein OHK0029_36740 [Armatimonadaceae bacterium]
MNSKYHGQVAPGHLLAQRAGALALAAVTMLLLAGCNDKPFGKVNGKVITMDEYVAALERQQVPVGQQTVNAGRLVLDQLIGQRIILEEASKLGVMPTESDVNNYYDFRKKLFEAQYPDKQFVSILQEQGTTEEELKSDIKYQLAETNVYAKRLSISRDEVQKDFETTKGEYLPARVQLRVIVAYPDSPQFKETKELLAKKTPFDEVAKKTNVLPNLVSSAGLLPQPTPINQINPKYQTEVQKRAAGDYFGPVDFNIGADAPPAKAWIKIENKLPAFTVGFDEAYADVLRRVVQTKMLMPENAKTRDEIMKSKLDATFEPTEAGYKTVWDAIKKQATDAGIGKIATGEVPVPGAPAAGQVAPGGPAGAPAGAPAGQAAAPN